MGSWYGLTHDGVNTAVTKSRLKNSRKSWDHDLSQSELFTILFEIIPVLMVDTLTCYDSSEDQAYPESPADWIIEPLRVETARLSLPYT